tara:strand:- start:3154 stop:3933 length:780 start_codon:yes stop_codon:yes gene_type:complete
MVNINTLINDLQLRDGETKRMTCPMCNNKEKTFTITNNMGQMLWNCYKASCSLSGGKKVHLTSDDIRKSIGSFAQETVEIPFELPEYIIPHNNNEDVLKFADTYGLDIETTELMYDVKDHRVVFPIVHGGKIVDATGRSLNKRLPKWKRYGKSDLPYTHGYGKVAVVVEDCVSAAVVGTVSDVHVGVAVLGTSLSESHKRYLSQFSMAVVALDPDALPKTLAFVRELKTHVADVKALRLTDDLKYRNQQDLDSLTNIGV